MHWRRVLGVVAIASSAATGYAQQAVAAPVAPAQATSAAPANGRTSVPPLERLVTLELRDVPLPDALRLIDRQADLALAFTNEVVPVKKRVSLSVKGVPASEALRRVLDGTGVKVRVTAAGTVILVREGGKERSKRDGDTAGQGVVYGRVVDAVSTKPLIAAQVSIVGDTLKAETNQYGFYLIPHVSPGVRTVVVRLFGYMKAEREVAVVDSSRVRADFELKMGMSRLQEVVTTATGPQRRMDMANDVTVINADSITATQPVTSVTDLLEGRVPGLVVQRTSGAPGDPARLRLRGVSSAHLSNDPIVIVDGIRIYAEQSALRSGNLAGSEYAAPGPLDYIDPNSIATIEVFKGPSAATLYGSDAANGVIVITTKKGRPGPPRWTVSVERGLTTMPGSYPDMLLRWGHSFRDNTPIACPINNTQCLADSVVHFQALNDPDLTILDQGQRTAATLSVSGGSDALTYSVTGSYASELGLVRLPGLEVERFRTTHGGVNPPGWMTRPQRLTQWAAASRIGARLGRRADIALTSRLSRTDQQRSSLERQISTLMATYVDRGTGTYYRPVPGAGVGVEEELLSDFYTRATADATAFTNGVNLTWRPWAWLTTSADAGLDVVQRSDNILLPRGMVATSDSGGEASTGRGTSLQSTVNVRAMVTVPLPLGLRLQTAVGSNYTKRSVTDLKTRTRNLAAGGSSVGQAGEITGLTEASDEVTTFGLYIEPTIAHKRFTITTGLRLDGGSAFGARAKLAAFPKVGVSYLVSDEPFFPFKNIFSTLRLRLAYGHAGVQPRPEDRLRLYRVERPWVDGQFVDGALLDVLGNTEIRPERSTELEGGFDADLLNERLSISFSGYRKLRVDALMPLPLPPSLGHTPSVLRNVGTIRNTGMDVTLTTQPVRTSRITWGVQASLSHNENVVVELGRGVEPLHGSTGIVAGYPLFGRWAQPLLGYDDRNGNDVIDPSEVLIGDTAVYVGATYPNYTAALQNTLSLFRGMFTVSASLAYEDGLTQQGPWSYLQPVSWAANDPTAPLGAQAVAVAAAQGARYSDYRTISTLRLNSLSVAFNAPPSLARRLGTRSLSIAIQGTNLALWTNYQGIDPNVNDGSRSRTDTGDGVRDTGVLPRPRMLQVRVRAGY